MHVSLLTTVDVCDEAFTIFVLFCFCFLGPHPWRREVPRLGVELELQLPVYATATATPDPELSERGQGSKPHLQGYRLGS